MKMVGYMILEWGYNLEIKLENSQEMVSYHIAGFSVFFPVSWFS